MVASISQMARGAETYYTDLAKEDYYINGGEPPGMWIGNAAAKLGLKGSVVAEDLSRVLTGFAKDGAKLVRNAGRDNRQAGWDMTFSAPKDVSIIWGIGDVSQRAAIEEAHNKAVKAAIDYLQSSAMFSRTGAGGKDWQKAEAVVATFLHGTSRDADPNLHSHALFANVGIREDSKSGTIVSKKLYENKMVAGLIYRATLAEGLSQQLGFELEQEKSWFRIKGFSDEARDFFSKRSNAIKAVAGPNATPEEKDRANLATRKVKGHVARMELHPEWQRQALSFGLDDSYLNNLFSSQPKKQINCSQEPIQEVCDKAFEELADSEGYFSKADFLRAVLSKTQTGQFKVNEILQQCEATLGGNIERLGQNQQKTEFFTSKKQLEREDELLATAEEMKREIGKPISKQDTKRIIEGSTVHKILKKVEAFINDRTPEYLRFKFTGTDYTKLNAMQKAALYQITSEMGSIKTVAGRAGTGKTTMLAAAREVWESKGYDVVGCSVSGKAAQGLAQGAGINSETVAMRLLELEKSAWKTLTTEARQLMRAFMKKNRFKREQFKLTKKSVLVIDEASMIDTVQLKKLLKHAHKAKAKVVLVGDNRQLSSISAGGGFAKLFKATHGYELTETVRQNTPWLKEAVDLFGDGDIRGAIDKFVKNDRLKFGCDNKAVRENLITDWSKNRTSNLAETVILAPTNKDVDALNQAAQDTRRRNGELEPSNFTWGETKYYTGDRIAFHANDRQLGVWNGDRGTIKAVVAPVTSFSVRFIVELDSGDTITFCPRQLGNKHTAAEEAISLGYASTIHKAQGMTVDKSFLMLDSNTSHELAYVGTTRSREDASIHCESRHMDEDTVQSQEAQEDLANQASRSQSKQMAVEAKRQLEEERQREAQQHQQTHQHTHEHNM